MTDGPSLDRLGCLLSFYFSFPNKSHYLLSNRWPNSKNRGAMSNLTQQVVSTLLLCNSLHLLNMIKSFLNPNQKKLAALSRVMDLFLSQKSTEEKGKKVISEPCSNIISFNRVKSLNKFSDSSEVGDGRFTVKHSRPFSLSAPINTSVGYIRPSRDTDILQGPFKMRLSTVRLVLSVFYCVCMCV